MPSKRTWQYRHRLTKCGRPVPRERLCPRRPSSMLRPKNSLPTSFSMCFETRNHTSSASIDSDKPIWMIRFTFASATYCEVGEAMFSPCDRSGAPDFMLHGVLHNASTYPSYNGWLNCREISLAAELEEPLARFLSLTRESTASKRKSLDPNCSTAMGSWRGRNPNAPGRSVRGTCRHHRHSNRSDAESAKDRSSPLGASRSQARASLHR